MIRSRNLLLLITALILLAAAGLRLHLLGAQSLWNDEGSSYVQATRSFSEIAANAARDIHPPGYYWLLGGWRLLTGTSEFALRSLSVFASLLSIAFAYALGRRLFGSVAAFTAALLITLNTFSIYYAQEARMYALLALWSAASMWSLAQFFQRRTWRWALLLALFNAAGLWTQYAYPFVMLAQGVVVLAWMFTPFRQRNAVSHQPSFIRTLGLYIAANLLTMLLYLPWLPTAIQQVTIWPNTGDATALPEAANIVFSWLSFGSTSPGAALAIPGILLLFGLLLIRRHILWKVLLPAAWVAISVGIFLALGMFRLDNIKLLLPAQIGLALWIGRGVSVLWTLRLKYGGQHDFAARLALFVPRTAAILSVIWLALIAVDGIAPLYNDPAYQRADYRALAHWLADNRRAGDVIILDAPNQAEVFGYYFHDDTPVLLLPEGLGGDDAATRARVEELIAAYERAFVVFWGEDERDPRRVVETTLDQGAFELGDVWYGDVRLARYVMPVPFVLVAGGVTFGDHITLERHGFSRQTIQSGDVLQAQFNWETDAPLTTRYKVFVQLLDVNSILAAQRDSEPGGGLALTTTWTPGETVVDQHALLVDVPPGEYTLIMGLYELDDPAVRLPLSSGGDFLRLAAITVTAAEN